MGRVFLSFFFIIGTVLIGFFYLKPAWMAFQDLREKTEALYVISAEIDALISRRDTLFESLGGITREDLARIDEALPRKQNAAKLIVFLENAAARRGILLSALGLQATTEGEAQPVDSAPGVPVPVGGTGQNPAGESKVQELAFTLNAAGPYESFKQFLGDIELSLRIIDAETVTFASPLRESEPLSFTLSLKTYYK